MSITDRNLAAGTKLVARYKGKEYTAEVVQTEEGVRYRLEDGREFKSPSSAGSAVMRGTACNGWRFWGLANGETVKSGKRERKGRKKNAPGAAFERMEDGRYFCSACMEAFDVADDQAPKECPQGHKPDDFQPN